MKALNWTFYSEDSLHNMVNWKIKLIQVQRIIGHNQRDVIGIIRSLTIVFLPKIAKMLDLPLLDRKATEFIVDVIKSSIELRRKEEERKNDLIDFLIDAFDDAINDRQKTTPENLDETTVDQVSIALTK